MKKLIYIVLIMTTLLFACKPQGTEQETPEVSNTPVPEVSIEIVPETTAQPVQTMPVIKKDGEEKVIPLIIENGEYLCELPNEKIVYSRMDEKFSAIKLLFKDLNSSEEVDLSAEFTSIESASPSKSGNFIAIIDIFEENRTLYVYDMQTDEMYNLGEEGLGTVTISYAWDYENDILYSISGSEGKLNLKKIDFTQGRVITDLDDQNIDQGEIKTAKGAIFFSDTSKNENGEIYKLNGGREKVSDGLVFALSGDAKYLAVQTESAGAEGDISDVTILDLQTDQKYDVIKDAAVTKFGFNKDNVFYLASADVEDMLYITTIFKYDTATQSLTKEFNTMASIFHISESKNRLYLPIYFFTRQLASGTVPNDHYETYVYDFES